MSDIAKAAALLLSLDDDYWTRSKLISLDNAIEDARRKAQRDGHKIRLQVREGFRAEMRAIMEIESKP